MLIAVGAKMKMKVISPTPLLNRNDSKQYQAITAT